MGREVGNHPYVVEDVAEHSDSLSRNDRRQHGGSCTIPYLHRAQRRVGYGTKVPMGYSCKHIPINGLAYTENA
jgi:hypothetical protein